VGAGVGAAAITAVYPVWFRAAGADGMDVCKHVASLTLTGVEESNETKKHRGAWSSQLLT
jgi:hypothetical protein